AGTAPAVYNAANEACVEAFWEGRIGFLDITRIVGECLDEHLADGHVADAELTLDAVLAADRWGRARATELAGAAA
ncbi:1-deoxy-D-xylulose-5-phosphate reductoisomerase, partial [Tessaracoccus lubricantis]